MKRTNVHMILFLSRSTSLRTWEMLGILERELAVYKRLRPHLGGLSIVTVGGREELNYQEIVGDIHILFNRWRLSPNLYSLLAPVLHWRTLRLATVYKTNQLDGAWTAIIAGWVHRKPVIVRGGFAWALNFRRATGGETAKGKLIRYLEGASLRAASRVVVTTNRLRDYVISNYQLPVQRVSVIPNYVDTNLFHPPVRTSSEAGRIVFIGALKSAKNLPMLLKAVAQLEKTELVLIGAGSLRIALERQAQALALNPTFTGRLPNERLPEEINRAEIFVLPSRYEGHPKALIEAMACGAAVVGTDVDGIREVIKHNETGLLCPPTVEGLKSALQQLLDDDSLRARLGQAARAFVKQHYSLDQNVEKELLVLREVQGGQ